MNQDRREARPEALLSNTIGREAVERAGPLYCGNCGYPNAPTARYCERCRSVLNDPE